MDAIWFCGLMVFSARHLLFGLCIAGFLLGAVLWTNQALSLAIMAISLLSGVIVIVKVPPPSKASYSEPQEMSEMPQKRQHELLRGTSLHLHKMKYRYSVRIDHNQTTDHCCFNAEVNSIMLGFIPVIITDNTTDKQGFGFVAFVNNGKRWLGPGLPCPGAKEQAIAHALECVSPAEDGATEQ